MSLNKRTETNGNQRRRTQKHGEKRMGTEENGKKLNLQTPQTLNQKNNPKTSPPENDSIILRVKSERLMRES